MVFFSGVAIAGWGGKKRGIQRERKGIQERSEK